MLFSRNPICCIVPVETGELEKEEKLMKLLGSFLVPLQLATRGHLIVHGLEDFWEAEADWWDLLIYKIYGEQRFYLQIFQVKKPASRNPLLCCLK